MSQENKIYEITQMMSDNQVIRGDVSHAAGVIKAMLNEKYIAPIARAIDAENKKARKNPSKEARLLAALKPFVDINSHRALEKAIDILYMQDTFRGLAGGMNRPRKPAATKAAAIDSIHEDGIYDIDRRCMEFSGQAAILPIFLMMTAIRASQL